MTMNSKKNPRGVFEKVPGSGEWWARYVDVNGKLRREKAGTKTATIALVEKRRTEVRERLKLPENFRARPASFADLSKDALAYSRARKLSHGDDQCRMSKIVEEFGDRIAEGITPQEIDSWLESHEEWMAATKNRYLALVKLTYRLAEENGKIKANPARLLHMRKENNARVRYLNQYEPLPTNLDYLKSCKDEESRLRAVIQAKYPFHMRELDIALHTGMRRGEQYCTDWANVNFERRMLTVPRSKHGEKRHIPLNAAALAAFTVLPNRATSNFVFLNMRGDDTLQSNRHWFEDAVAAAGIRDFTWHDLRHTFASRLIMVGVDLRTVQELMGHKTIQMTCRYAHLAPAHQLAAVERLLSFSSAADMLTEEMSSGKRKSRNGNKTGNVSGHREILNSSNSSLSYSLADASTISEPRTAILEQSTDTSTDTEAKGAIETVSDVVQ